MAEMKMLRSSLRVTMMDRIRAEQIRGIVKAETKSERC